MPRHIHGYLALPFIFATFSRAQEPFPRIHAEVGAHTTWVGDLFFRNDDRELVSVSRDRSIRVWSLDPKHRDARCRNLFYLPAVPRASSLRSDGRFLACAFNHDKAVTGVPNRARVAILDLDEVGRGKVVPVAEIDLDNPNGNRVITAMKFSPEGDRIVVGTSDGCVERYRFDPAQEKRLTREKQSHPFASKQPVYHLDFGSEDRLVAVVGDRELWVGDGKSLAGWKERSLFEKPKDGPEIRIDAIAGRDDRLALGYSLLPSGSDQLMRGKLRLIPLSAENKGVSNEVDLQVSRTSQLAWSSDGKSLLAATGGNDWGLYPAFRFPLDPMGQFVLKSVERLDPLGASTSACAFGKGDTFAYASETGEIFVQKNGGRIWLERGDRSQPTLTGLGWDDAKSNLILHRLDRRDDIVVFDKGLWKLVGLDGAKCETVGRYVQDGPDASPERPANLKDDVTCCVRFPGGRVEGTSDELRLIVESAPMRPAFQPPLDSPGFTSLLNFKGSPILVSLGLNGFVTFWEYEPDRKENNGIRRARLTRLATGFYMDGQFHYVAETQTSLNLKATPYKGSDMDVYRIDPRKVEPDHLAPFHLNLDRDRGLLAGTRANIAIRPFALGKLTLTVNDRTYDAVAIAEDDLNRGLIEIPIDVPPLAKRPDPRIQLTVRFQSADPKVPTSTETRVVEVRKPGRVLLIDVTPQSLQEGDGVCSDIAVPNAPNGECRATAEELEKLLKRMVQNELTRVKCKNQNDLVRLFETLMKDTPLPEYGGKPFKLAPEDSVVLFFKGHAGRDPKHGMKLLDGADGITKDDLRGHLAMIRNRSQQVLVLLDCCHAEEFLDNLHIMETSFFPCTLRDEKAAAVVFRKALASLNAQEKCPFRRRNGYVEQGEFLDAIRKAYQQVCDDPKQRIDARPGNPLVVGQFAMGWGW